MQMRKTLGLFAGIFLLISLGSLFSQEYNLTGTWVISSPNGWQSEMEIKQEGNKITVTMMGNYGPITAEGKVEGNKVLWVFLPGDLSQTTYKGEIVDKDHMEGEVERGGRTVQWTAVRKSY